MWNDLDMSQECVAYNIHESWSSEALAEDRYLLLQDCDDCDTFLNRIRYPWRVVSL